MSEEKNILDDCKLTYFSIPGRGEVARLCLAYGGINFQDERVQFQDWGALKASTPWLSLPFLTLADGTVVSQTRALSRFVARSVGLYPSDLVAAASIDALYDVFEDIMGKINAAGDGMAQPEKEAKRAAEVATGTSAILLQKVDDFIKTNGIGGFAVGSSFTLADILVFSYGCFFASGFYDGVSADAIFKFENIRAVLQTTGSNPAVKGWYAKRGELKGNELFYAQQTK